MPAMAPWVDETVTVSLPSTRRAGFLMGSHEDAAPGAGHGADCKGACVSRVMYAMVKSSSKCPWYALENRYVLSKVASQLGDRAVSGNLEPISLVIRSLRSLHALVTGQPHLPFH